MSDRPPTDDPDYGPSGYLPERAARRARKIVLRAPLGLPWLLAAVGVGIVLAAVALVFLLALPGTRPGPPYQAVGPVDAIGAVRYDEGRGVLYVGAAGRVRAFLVEGRDVPVFCPVSGRLESHDGRVWSLTGRALDGRRSLAEYPTRVGRDRTLYVDFGHPSPGPPPEEADAKPACVGAADPQASRRGS